MAQEQNDFAQRMHEASQDVYAQIVQGNVGDVEATLMDAHLNASANDK
ncbi:hypothetical protein ACIP93_29625 [Streptomyces sp. NPDC088745]